MQANERIVLPPDDAALNMWLLARPKRPPAKHAMQILLPLPTGFANPIKIHTPLVSCFFAASPHFSIYPIGPSSPLVLVLAVIVQYYAPYFLVPVC